MGKDTSYGPFSCFVFSYLMGTVHNSRTLAGEPTRIPDSRQHSVGEKQEGREGRKL